MTQMIEAPAQVPVRRSVNMKSPVGSAMTLKALLEQSKQQIADVLPAHLTPDRMMRVALVAVNKQPKLLECTMESVLQAIIQAASLGLDPGGALGSAYLVPYKTTCTLIPGFRGLIDLARRSGEIASISADVVYKHDKFVYRKGDDPVLQHEPDIFAEQKDEDIIGAYMVAHLKDGGKHIEFMNRQQIEKIRASSRAAWDWNGNPTGPWKDHFPEMCRKTVVRRGCKYLPISSEKLAQALEIDNEDHDPGMSVSVAQSQSRTEALLSKVTSRPVSDGQKFEPTPEALAQAESDAAAGETTEAAPEPDVPPAEEAIETGPPPKPVPMPALMTSHELLTAAIDGAAQDLGVTPSASAAWILKTLDMRGIKDVAKQAPKVRYSIFEQFVKDHGGSIAAG